jgi:hypothetical protein
MMAVPHSFENRYILPFSPIPLKYTYKKRVGTRPTLFSVEMLLNC